MSTTLNALYYIHAWNNDTPIDGEMAHRGMLLPYRLDYSVASLGRIDQFLDKVREQVKPTRQHLDRRPYQNLLFFLAFYTGEVIGRMHGSPPLWQSYAQVVENVPSHAEAFSDCFENCLCCRFPGVVDKDVDFFHPLYALATRFLEGDSGKSILFSAGLFMPARGKETASPAAVPPPIKPRLFGEPLDVDISAASYPYALTRPRWMSADDKLNYLLEHADALLKQGQVVWGATIRANGKLFEPAYGVGYPAEVVYDPAGRLPPEDLLVIAHQLYELQAKNVADETHAVFFLDVPQQLTAHPLKMSATYVDQLFLPDGMLTLRAYPLLIHKQWPGAVLVLPWQCWPKPFLELWMQASEEKFGTRHSSETWRKQYNEALEKELERRKPKSPNEKLEEERKAAQNAEALFEEGVRHFSGRGTPQDYAKARQFWETAGAARHLRSLNNLGTMHLRGLGVTPSPELAFAYFIQAADQGLALAQLNLGKMLLGGLGIEAHLDSAESWLKQAAEQGNQEAAGLLHQHFGNAPT